MSELKEKCKVVMLPETGKTNSLQGSPFFRMLQKNELVTYDSSGQWSHYVSLGFKPQHLYVVSDKQAKIGEYYLGNDNNIYQVDTYTDTLNKPKVIATTDNSITITKYGDYYLQQVGQILLPTISKSFITKYVEQYNLGTPITDVLVDYEVVFLPINAFPSEQKHVQQLKLRNNELIITKVKDSWSREEIELLTLKAFIDGMQYENMALRGFKKEAINYITWKSKNL